MMYLSILCSNKSTKYLNITKTKILSRIITTSYKLNSLECTMIVNKHSIEGIGEETIAKANQILKNLGYVTLHHDGVRVVPVWNGAPDGSYHAVLNEKNKGLTGEDQVFWSDCFRISAACLGSEVVPEEWWFKENVWALLKERPIAEGNVELEPVNCKQATNMAEKFCFSVLKKYRVQLEEFKEAHMKVSLPSTTSENTTEQTKSNELHNVISRLKPTTTVVKSFGCIDGRAKELIPAKDQNNDEESKEYYHLWELYSRLYFHEKFRLDLSQKLQINEHVKPQVGDTLIIVPAMKSPTWSRWIIKSGYNPNFHWAPVVLSLDDGYICLENFAVPDPREINNLWEFRYYKYSEGGYHNKLMDGGGYGNIAMTLLVRMKSNKDN
eukprot:TRINITY_DN3475_c0_g1_i1.p1 TRINITY_DN3475_c0_g1~~TRINITY_DN3475_c0_g1_i1.p1  ORF type:complete len:382 (-),score=43.04 TRINITY_DN3475_c0_g1_i1:30-1175(-)